MKTFIFIIVLLLSYISYASENSKLSQYSEKNCQDIKKTSNDFSNFKLHWLKIEAKKTKDPNNANSFYNQHTITFRSENGKLLTIQDIIQSIEIDCIRNVLSVEFSIDEGSKTEVYDLLLGQKILRSGGQFTKWSPDNNFLILGITLDEQQKYEALGDFQSNPVIFFDCRFRKSKKIPCTKFYETNSNSNLHNPKNFEFLKIKNPEGIEWGSKKILFQISYGEGAEIVQCDILDSKTSCNSEKQILPDENYLIWSPDEKYVISGNTFINLMGTYSTSYSPNNFPISIHDCSSKINGSKTCKLIYQLGYESVILNPRNVSGLPIKNDLGIEWKENSIKFQVARTDKGFNQGNNVDIILRTTEIELFSCSKVKNEYRCDSEKINYNPKNSKQPL